MFDVVCIVFQCVELIVLYLLSSDDTGGDVMIFIYTYTMRRE